MREYEYRDEMNFLLTERKNATKKNIVQFIDNYIHQLTLKQRKERKRRERVIENLPYEVLSHHYDDVWGDGWEKRFYPGERWTREEIKQYKLDEWVHVTSPYDCSGQWFTQRIEVFNVPSGVVVYYFEGIDC